MNKEFEKQYRDYITEQVPDMWSRIEAGLKEKHTADREDPEWPEEKKNIVLADREEKRVWWKNKSVTVLVPAAAAVFLCLLIPAAFFGNHSKSESGGMNASPAFSGEREVYEMTNGGEAAENKSMAMPDSGEKADQDMADGAGMAEGDGAASAEMDCGAVEEAEAGITENFRVKVRITETAEAGESAYAMLYAAEVLEAAETEGDLSADFALEGTEIYFYAGENTDKTEGEELEIGGEYEVVLEPVPGEDKYFAKKIYFIP